MSDHLSDLLDLIRFGLTTIFRLQVEDLDNVGPRENVMVTSNSFIKPQCIEEASKRVESDVGVRPAAEHGV